MDWIDVRSDTVTHPTQAMRDAMAHAVVGDDVYGDDPTVTELESLAATLTGKEAALFVPSGTFGNQLALFSHCERGDEVILGDDCHIVWHEVGAAAIIAGVNIRPVLTDRGVIDPAAIRQRIRPGGDIHLPKTGLLCLENAHSNGRVIGLDAMQACFDVAREANIPVHLDGARVFNAAAALQVDVRDITRYSDSVMFCLSKGLAAPVGSILAGESGFIGRARKKRKLLGGGLRQAGVLAAPGLLALTEMSQRLHEDHAHARLLADGLDQLTGLRVLRDQLDINMVFFELAPSVDGGALMAGLSAHGIKANPPEQGIMRLVTHWQIDRSAIDRLVAAFRAALR